MHSDAKILVLGHRGLIGSAIMRRLQSQGYNRLVGASRSEVDLEDPQAVEGYFTALQPDYVFLCAGSVGGIKHNQFVPADFIFSNLSIQMNVLRQSHRHDVKNVILYSSSCIYPLETVQPMAVSAILTGALEPTSLPYAISKLAGLQMCLALNKQYGGQRFIHVIPNSVYGPNDNVDPESGHVLSALIHRIHRAHMSGEKELVIWGSGTLKREFVHVDDVADASIHLMRLEKAPQGSFNLGTGSDIAILDLAQRLAEIIGYCGKLVSDASKADGAPRKLLDSSKIRQTGWSSFVTLEEGLERTYTWYVANYQEGVRT